MVEKLGKPISFLIRGALALGLASVCAACMTSSPGSGQPATALEELHGSQPNVLFILIDDMGYGDFSILGDSPLETTTLDRLASEGLLIEQFYLGAAVCSPSRAAFFTGDFPAEHRFVSFIHDRASNARRAQADWLDPAEPNMAQMFKGAGYATGHFGKWHLGGGRDVGDAPHPTAYGFEDSFVNFEGLGPRALISDHPVNLSRQSEQLGQGPVTWLPKHQLTPAYIERAQGFIQRNLQRPWFVQLWLDDVHSTWEPAPHQLAAVDGLGRSPEETKYFAVLKAMDNHLARLVEWLDAQGEARDTLIIIASDNGPEGGARYYRNGNTAPGSTGGLRGRKWSLYEGGIRSPLILYWPAGISRGRIERDQVAAAVDLLPTLATLAGVEPEEVGDGVDLTSVLNGAAAIARPPLLWAGGPAVSDAAFPSPFRPRDRSPPLAIRDGRFKLLQSRDGRRVELFDLLADPAETTNIARDRPNVTERLQKMLRQWSEQLPSGRDRGE